MYEYRAKLIRCVDGDTIDMDVDLGGHIHAVWRLRLLDVDTPERGDPDFDVATLTLEGLIVDEADTDGWIHISTHGYGKYGRLLAKIGEDGCITNIMSEKWPYER